MDSTDESGLTMAGCTCCSCTPDSSDQYCREHGNQHTRQCDEHRMPGVSGSEVSDLVSTQERLVGKSP
jgi:hypothetical protein